MFLVLLVVVVDGGAPSQIRDEPRDGHRSGGGGRRQARRGRRRRRRRRRPTALTCRWFVCFGAAPSGAQSVGR